MEFKGLSLILAILSIVAIIIALQTTVIFIVVLFIACKYRKRRDTPRQANTVGKFMEEQLYEAVDPGINDMPQKAPVQVGHKSKIQVEKNSSYALHIK